MMHPESIGNAGGLAKCGGCGAAIVWMVTGTGKRIPVDAETVPNPETARAFRPKEGHRAHFATCPKAQKFRKKP